MSSANQPPDLFSHPICSEERHSTHSDCILPTRAEVPKMTLHRSPPSAMQKYSTLHGYPECQRSRSILTTENTYCLPFSWDHQLPSIRSSKQHSVSLYDQCEAFETDFSKDHNISPLSFNGEVMQLLRSSQSTRADQRHQKNSHRFCIDDRNVPRKNRPIWPFKIKKNEFASRKIALLGSLASRRTRNKAKEIIQKQLQTLHCFLKEQEVSSGCNISESLLSELAKRHPQYGQIIRALPLLMKIVPEGLKELMQGETGELLKTGMMIVKQWSPTRS